MSIDIVLITTSARSNLMDQTIVSMNDSASNPKALHLVIVLDGYNYSQFGPTISALARQLGKESSLNFFTSHRLLADADTLIINEESQGASAARNIGASSIPKYRRQQYVMFCDDDCYFVKGWDQRLLRVAYDAAPSIVSGYGHPFNQPDTRYPHYDRPLVISSVNMLMPWSLWDDVGFFTEPGGAGGSEDYDYCMRAKAKGYGFAVTHEQCVIHTGLTSSTGKPIVGQKEVIENNRRLMDIHGLKDVLFE